MVNEIYYREASGQYSLFANSPNKKSQEDTLLTCIQNANKEALELMKVKKEYLLLESLPIEEAEKKKRTLYVMHTFTTFIQNYFESLKCYSDEEIAEKYENMSESYHLLGKLFLFYLHTFIYNNGILQVSMESLVIQMEDFVLKDPIKHRDSYYTSILKTKVLNRRKLRVNQYIVYQLAPFLKRMTAFEQSCVEMEEMSQIVETKKIAEQFYQEVKIIQEDSVLFDTIFGKREDFIVKENKDVLVILFLKYLEHCVYLDSFVYPNVVVQNFVAKVEEYVICQFRETICLSLKEEKIYSYVKEQVARRMQSSVEKEERMLFQMLKEYDALEDFKTSGKFKYIEVQEKKEDLTPLYNREEIQLKLQTFLDKVFLLSSGVGKERLPIYSDGLEKIRKWAYKLGLEYLSRFVYAFSEWENFDDPFVVRLEYFLASCKFTVKESSLCLAKSILYARTNVRNTLKNPSLFIKVLKCDKK